MQLPWAAAAGLGIGVDMTKHPNIAVARRLWNAIATADVEQLQAVITPDAVWTMPGRSPLAGCYEGIDAIVGFMALTGELADELESQLLDIFTSDRGVILRYSVHATRRGRVLDIEHLFMIRIVHGYIVEGVFAPIDQDLYDRFWVDESASHDGIVEDREGVGSTTPAGLELDVPTA
jgi:ketosteroid isomerase-like protein